MVTKTLRYPVFFGRTVSAEAKAVSYKTSCQIPDWGNAFEFSKIVSAGNQEVYKKIDEGTSVHTPSIIFDSGGVNRQKNVF